MLTIPNAKGLQIGWYYREYLPKNMSENIWDPSFCEFSGSSLSILTHLWAKSLDLVPQSGPMIPNVSWLVQKLRLLQIVRLSIVVDFHGGGCVTTGATKSSFTNPLKVWMFYTQRCQGLGVDLSKSSLKLTVRYRKPGD